MRMPGIIFLLIPVLFLCLTGAAVADPISDDEGSPATAAEMQFINRVIDQVKAALPPLEGWERNLSSYLGDDQGGFRQGDKVKIFEYERKIPLRLCETIRRRRTISWDGDLEGTRM